MKYDYANLSDEELFELFSKEREASNRAFNEIYRRYSGKIFSYLHRIFGDKFFIKDIFQDVFTSVYRIGAEGRLKNVYNFRSYLYQTAKNTCYNHFKHKKRTEEVQTDFMHQYSGEISEIGDTLEMVRQAVSKLPENLREIFVMYEYEELNLPAIAEITGDTQINVRVKLHRARKMLKEMVISIRNNVNNMV